MNKLKLIVITLFLACSFSLPAQQKEYKASMFGIKSDGITLNTNSIQKAIDYISENGGGQLTFWVGRYRTGTIHLKSNVTVELREGAALVASTSPYDYDHVDGVAALVIAKDQENIRIFGKGLIEGEGAVVNRNIDEQTAKGNLPKGQGSFRPAILYMANCANITVEGILLDNAGGHVQEFTNCKNVTLTNITVNSRLNPATKGIVLKACAGVTLDASYIDTPSTALALSGAASKNVAVKNSKTPDGKKIQAN